MVNLDLEVFERFVNKYRKTYGKAKMTDEQAASFYERVINVKMVDFEKVNEMLLDSHMSPYKAETVLDRVNIMFPSKESRKQIEDAWKLNYDADGKKDVKLIHSQISS